MVAIVRRKLTKNPQLAAGREPLGLTYRLKWNGTCRLLGRVQTVEKEMERFPEGENSQ